MRGWWEGRKERKKEGGKLETHLFWPTKAETSRTGHCKSTCEKERITSLTSTAIQQAGSNSYPHPKRIHVTNQEKSNIFIRYFCCSVELV